MGTHGITAMAFPSKSRLLRCQLPTVSRRYTNLKTKTRKMTMNNTIVLGASGINKIKNYIIPQIRQTDASFIIQDPGGIISKDFNIAQELINQGYQIFNLDTKDFQNSNSYNPMHQLYDTYKNPDIKKISQLVTRLLDSQYTHFITKNSKKLKIAESFLTFAILYVLEFLSLDKHNLYETLLVTQQFKPIWENSECPENTQIIQNIQKSNPQSKCLQFYHRYTEASDEIKRSALAAVSIILAPFAENRLRTLTSTQNLNLSIFGQQKATLFMITPTADSPYHFLHHILYHQIQNECIQNTNTQNIMFVLDEFSPVQQLITPETLADSKKNIYYFVSLGCRAQLNYLYQNHTKIILENMEIIEIQH